ncbi:response regulator transcription factor [Curvivirga sp.]|uniref:response regulator transcription factor n=1 Tax=Curvivirga sp. TaxID=2856848 RepID=UPI003B5B9530
MRILLIEDNQDLAETILERFKAEGHAIDHEVNGEVANDLLRFSQFELVILDVNLPGKSGFDVLRSLRARNDDTPVLLLTARSEVSDRVTGLDAGADDYLLKPFDFRELLARCRVLARRKSGNAKNEFRIGELAYDSASKRATLAGRDLELRNREVQLFELFLSNLDRVLTKEELADHIYTFDEAPSLNAVEQSLTRLRKKLGGTPFHIKTIRGLGYIAHVDEDI